MKIKITLDITKRRTGSAKPGQGRKTRFNDKRRKNRTNDKIDISKKDFL